MLVNAALAPHPDRVAAIERAWAQLTGPGVELNSAQRHQIIRDARAAWSGAATPNGSSGVAGEAAHWIAIDAEGLTPELIEDFEQRGLSRWQYLEIVGVVSRLANVDFYLAGLGADPLMLPEQSPTASDTATSERSLAAEMTNMWVPTIGRSYAPMVLDALPAEGNALRDLHEPMYLYLASVGDTSINDVLTKSQIEFLAARTSYLNECFY